MRNSHILVTSVMVALAATYAVPTHAASEGAGWSNFGAHPALIGVAPSMAADCPAMEFHVVPTEQNKLVGVAFEGARGTQAAMSMKLYNITGTLSDEGKVAMDLKPLSDGGTPIKVDGTFKMGMLMASIAGHGTCHSTSFMLMPVAMPVPPSKGG